GDWVNNGTFTSNTSTVTLAGANQPIDGSLGTNFHDLAITGGGIKTLNVNATVGGTLDLTSGVVATGGNTLTVGASGNIINASASSYVHGNLRRNWPDAASGEVRDYPIGDATNFTPV